MRHRLGIQGPQGAGGGGLSAPWRGLMTQENYRAIILALCDPCRLRLIEVLSTAMVRGQTHRFTFAACPTCDPKLDPLMTITPNGDRQ